MWKEFKEYLLKQNALALALAVVIGTALNKVVQALVNDLIMPVVAKATPGGDWATWAPEIAGMKFGIGDLSSALLNFVIIGFVAWRISKIMVPPATPSRSCPFCRSSIDMAATRCPQCTSQIA